MNPAIVLILSLQINWVDRKLTISALNLYNRFFINNLPLPKELVCNTSITIRLNHKIPDQIEYILLISTQMSPVKRKIMLINKWGTLKLSLGNTNQ